MFTFFFLTCDRYYRMSVSGSCLILCPLRLRYQTTWTTLTLQWTSRLCGTSWSPIATSLSKPLKQILALLSTTASNTTPRTPFSTALPCALERWAGPSSEQPGDKRNGSASTTKPAYISPENSVQRLVVTRRGTESVSESARGSGNVRGSENVKKTLCCPLTKTV